MNVKETRDVMIAINDLVLFLIDIFRDGAQLSDAFAVYNKLTADEDFKAKLIAAYEGINLVDDEMRDIDIAEIVELSSLQLSFLPQIMDAIGGPDGSDPT